MTGNGPHPDIGRSIRAGAQAVALAAVVFASVEASAQTGAQVSLTSTAVPDAEITFTKDIAPLLQQNCQVCHQPDGMAPMSLTTYEEVRPWARLIKDRTSKRLMPPWHIDRSVGIQRFKNDISLTDEQIAMIAAWVDAGAPQGDPADMPAPVVWPDDTGWQLEQQFGRPPDLIVRTTPFTVKANGNDQWWEPKIPVTGLAKRRYIMANETRPTLASRPVTHHANSDISNFGVGKPFDVYPADTGQPIEPGDTITFNVHYYPVGTEVKDAYLEVGVWLYPEDQEPRLKTEGDRNFSSYRRVVGDVAQEMVLPPHSTTITQGIHVIQNPARIHSIRGHMHLLGTAQSIEAVYPDGRVEILGRLFWKHNWHITYLYEDDAAPLLPKGTVLIVTSWYDNTANNPANPDPDSWKVHGRRTADEMSHMWIGWTDLTQEDYDRLVAEREAKKTSGEGRETR